MTQKMKNFGMIGLLLVAIAVPTIVLSCNGCVTGEDDVSQLDPLNEILTPEQLRLVTDQAQRRYINVLDLVIAAKKDKLIDREFVRAFEQVRGPADRAIGELEAATIAEDPFGFQDAYKVYTEAWGAVQPFQSELKDATREKRQATTQPVAGMAFPVNTIPVIVSILMELYLEHRGKRKVITKEMIQERMKARGLKTDEYLAEMEDFLTDDGTGTDEGNPVG